MTVEEQQTQTNNEAVEQAPRKNSGASWRGLLTIALVVRSFLPSQSVAP
jgi:hypothetical protein